MHFFKTELYKYTRCSKTLRNFKMQHNKHTMSTNTMQYTTATLTAVPKLQVTNKTNSNNTNIILYQNINSINY